MIILTDNELPLKNKTVISVGGFDGVHLGHRRLIEKMGAYAADRGLDKIVYTFAQNPKNILSGVKYITGSEEKMALLGECGADKIYFADFDSVCGVSPTDFAEKILIGDFNAAAVVCGDGFYFGKDRAGDVGVLRGLMEKNGAECIAVPPVEASDGSRISSSLIRKRIAGGEPEKAAELLGRKYSFTLPVVHGRKVGRSLGFPTLNQIFPGYRIVPLYGVYAVTAETRSGVFNGISNIGVRPTVDSGRSDAVCETHLFGFNEELYGQEVRISLEKRIREERRFPSMDELKKQIEEDITEVKKFFGIR